MKFNGNSISTVFFDMGNTLLDFHQGISDSNKDLIGAKEIASYLSNISKRCVLTDLVWSGFIKKWLDVMPKRSSRSREFDPYEFLALFLDDQEIKLTSAQSLEVLKLCDLGYQKHLVVMPGARNVFKFIKKQKVKIGIISNSPQVDEVNIDHFKSIGLSQYIDQYTFSYGAKCRKPSVDIFNLAIEKLGVNTYECMMVGDRLENDILPAKELGMEGVWINRDSKVKSMNHLLELI